MSSGDSGPSYYTLTERERIAILEQEVHNLRDDLSEVKADVKLLLAKLNELSGGKKALLAIFSALGALIGVAATVVTFFIKGKL